MTDPDGNTTSWNYDAQNRLVLETDPLDNARHYARNAFGDLLRYTDRNGRVRQYAYDDDHRVTGEAWYANSTDADAGQNAENSLVYAYDSLGRIVSESDADSINTYAYDPLGRIVSTTAASVLAPTVVLTYQYQGSSTKPSSVAASIDGTADFVNGYEYDSQGRLVRITQAGQPGGNAVASKEICLAYNDDGQLASLDRYVDGQLAVEGDYTYDSSGRLVGLIYSQGDTILASYAWTYEGDGSAGATASSAADPWAPNGGLPVVSGLPIFAGQGMLPVTDTSGIVDSVLRDLAQSDACRVTSCTSLDGTVTYGYDAQGQLTAADYSAETLSDESYTYDANGNRIGGGYVVGSDNRLLSNGHYTYAYDAEGNRTVRFVDADQSGTLTAGDTDVTQYAWDARNRLSQITDHSVAGAAVTQVVDYLYDMENRWIGETVDVDGDGVVDRTIGFVYDGQQIVLEFERDGNGSLSGADLSHRYLWKPDVVDQLLADEQLFEASLDEGGAANGHDPQRPGAVVWTLADRLGTVQDLAIFDPDSGTTEVANHRIYDSFGDLRLQTDPAIDCLIGFTGLPFDKGSGTSGTPTRPYDAIVGRWVQADWIALGGGQTNLDVYCGNSPTNVTDPSGLSTVRSWLPGWMSQWYEDKLYEISHKDPKFSFRIVTQFEAGDEPYASSGCTLAQLREALHTIDRNGGKIKLLRITGHSGGLAMRDDSPVNNGDGYGVLYVYLGGNKIYTTGADGLQEDITALLRRITDRNTRIELLGCDVDGLADSIARILNNNARVIGGYGNVANWGRGSVILGAFREFSYPETPYDRAMRNLPKDIPPPCN